METASCSPNGFSSIKLQPKWATVYLIGGGPSLRGFDLQRLQGHAVVAINDAILHLPWATALFSLDLCWMNNRLAEIAAFSGQCYLAVPMGAEIIPKLPPDTILLERIPGFRGLSGQPSRIYVGGGNSGFGAFNLAVLAGAKRIVLLGYDFCRNAQHWHEGYAWKGNSNERMYNKWGEQFQYTLPTLRTLGIEVLNASKISSLNLFPKISLSSLPLPEEVL
jgi:hypothetical protein